MEGKIEGGMEVGRAYRELILINEASSPTEIRVACSYERDVRGSNST